MLPDLQTLFDAMAHEGDSVQAVARALSPAQLARVPAPGEWCALQIVHHLVLADEAIGLPTATPPRSKPLTPLMHRVIVTAMNRNVRLPLPDPSVDPAGDVPLPELIQRWEVARGELRAFLDGVTPEAQSRKPFAHSIIGPMMPRQMLELGVAHTAYHRRQLERLVRTLA